jgi:hypothetical protein
MYYKRFSVTGVANVTTLDAGLVSLVGEKYRVNAILITISTYLNNVLEGWIGTERVLEIPDYVLDTFELNAATFNSRSVTKLIRIPIEMDIPEGQIFKIGVRCGAVANDIYGAYEYVKIV